jgi:hypothetical protein
MDSSGALPDGRITISAGGIWLSSSTEVETPQIDHLSESFVDVPDHHPGKVINHSTPCNVPFGGFVGVYETTCGEVFNGKLHFLLALGAEGQPESTDPSSKYLNDPLFFQSRSMRRGVVANWKRSMDAFSLYRFDNRRDNVFRRRKNKSLVGISFKGCNNDWSKFESQSKMQDPAEKDHQVLTLLPSTRYCSEVRNFMTPDIEFGIEVSDEALPLSPRV